MPSPLKFQRTALVSALTLLLTPVLSSTNEVTTPSKPEVRLLNEIPAASTQPDPELPNATSSSSSDNQPSAQKVLSAYSSAIYVEFDDFLIKGKKGNQTLTKGKWQGVRGSFAPNESTNEWYRATIAPYSSLASSKKLRLDTSIKEAWASYEIQLGDNWTPNQGVKLPGFSGHTNDGWLGAAGGNGGGWGGLCKSWSARTLIAPQGSATGRLRMYVYHAESENHAGIAKRSDHPCTNSNNNPVLSNKRTFGTTFNSTGHITDGQWHTVTHHVRLNDIGEYNGVLEIYLDGVLISRETGLNLTDNPDHHNIAMWFIVYHGGEAETTGTAHDIFFHNFRWNAGPTNLTLVN